jgi:hypothetical protein
MFRLHIDVPLGTNKEEALTKASNLIGLIQNDTTDLAMQLQDGQVKVSDDTDRASRNYLIVNEQGHVGTKKIPLKKTATS